MVGKITSEEIQKQDLIEELGDIIYLNEQKERILKLSEELREKGLLEGTAGEFIAKEYHLFDKSAEKVEEEIRRLGLKLKSNEFLMDFLNSTEFVSKDEIFVPITDAIHALCRKFAQDNGHRIIGQDNLDIWKLLETNMVNPRIFLFFAIWLKSEIGSPATQNCSMI